MSPFDMRAGYEASEDAVDQRAPMAALPAAAGDVVAVMQSETRGVLTQRVVLRGDPGTIGENAIVVRVDRSRGPSDLGGAVGPPTQAMIAGELDDAFAGVDMQLSETFARNSFGPFGYAVGHPSRRVTCVYAWQWGLAKPAKLGDGPTGALSMPTQPTSARVRLCRSSIGEAEMLAMLQQMQVFPPNSRVAYVDPDYSGVAETRGDALASAGVGYFAATHATPARDEDAPPRRARKVAHHHRHPRHERLAAREGRETRAAEVERLDPGEPVAPMPAAGGSAPAPAQNPLLAPLSAAAPARAPADDLPLPTRAAAAKSAPTAAPASAASIPLPN